MIFFLDISGPLSFFTPLLILMILIIVTEAAIMLFFKLNRIGKSLGDSTIINITSVLIIFLIIGILAEVEVGAIDAPLVLTATGLYILTFLGESLVLKLLNRKLLWSKIITASAVMNLVTCILLYFYYITSFNP